MFHLRPAPWKKHWSRIIYVRWCSCVCVRRVSLVHMHWNNWIAIYWYWCTAFYADSVMVCNTFHWMNSVIFSTSFVPNAKHFQSSYVLPSIVFASFSLSPGPMGCLIMLFLFCVNSIVRFQFHFDSSVILLSMNLSPSYATFCDCNMRGARNQLAWKEAFFPCKYHSIIIRLHFARTMAELVRNSIFWIIFLRMFSFMISKHFVNFTFVCAQQ